jgi:lycopene cyclase domain-containing protein
MMGRATYILWIVGCAGPVLVLHWAVGRRALAARLRAVIGAAVIATAYLSLVDGWAIRAGVWEFSPDLTLGLRIGAVPVEEIVFFWMTSLLVAQTLALFEPKPV